MPKPLQVLLIEDSETDALLLTRYLRRNGYDLTLTQVDTAAALQQALNQHPWDVVISDFNLPQFSGMAALNLIHQNKLDIPFIIVSGAIGEETAVDAMLAGAHDYVMKDNLARLVPAIERELREAEVRRQRRLAEEEVRRQNLELSLLNRVVAATTTLSSPEAILTTVCYELGQNFMASSVTAVQFDPNTDTAVTVAQFAATACQPPTAPVLLTNNPLYQYLISYKIPLVINQILQDSRLEHIRTILHQPDTTSLLLLPLIIKGGVIGGIYLESTQPRHFTPDQIRLAENVAHQTSGALARAQLDAAHQLLSQALEQAAESVIITKTDGRIVYVNPAFEQISGYTAAEVLDRDNSFLRHHKHDSQFYLRLWNIIKAGQIWQGRLYNKRKDGGTYITDVTVSPVKNEQGAIENYVVVQHDVTRETQLEEQYLQAQKMEAVGQLTAGISHDFNNLLTAINGFASLLHSDLITDPQHTDMLEKIINAGQRAAELVRQLLTFSRKQIAHPQPLDLNASVSGLHKMLNRIIGENIDLQLDLSPAPNWIQADPTQIEQIIMNLVVNARDAMPTGGRLTIATAKVTLNEQPLAADSTELWARLTVADNGIGIPDDIKKRIFEPFFTTKELGKGTGLGLATVLEIVQQYGGRILVNSQPHNGTTFEIYLPCIPAAANPVSQTAVSQPCAACTETILVVEDDNFVGDLINRVLKKEGYTVLLAHNTSDAIQLARAYAKPIDMLLTDVVMPDGSGPTLASQLVQTRPDLKVLFMSGYADTTLIQHGIRSDVALLQKPFRKSNLITRVRAVLDS